MTIFSGPLRQIRIMDGGMGRLLERLGAPFRLPEWSALPLIEAPEYVARAHRLFIDSGAQIITTNSYGLVPHMLGEARFARDARALAERAGDIARQAAGDNIRVAGSLPPLFESYQPDKFSPEQAPAILAPLIAGLAPYIDFWLIETQSSTDEALATVEEVRKTSALPIAVSYTLKDEAGRRGPPQLRSGEDVARAVAETLEQGVTAVLFNCSQPEVMEAAIIAARQTRDRLNKPGVLLGVYANAFAPEPPSDTPYAGISTLRADLDPPRYLQWVERWIACGATLVGGCCGIGPEHIAAIRDRYHQGLP